MKEISSEQRLKTGLAQQLIGANPVILNIKFHISLLSVVDDNDIEDSVTSILASILKIYVSMVGTFPFTLKP